MTTLNYIEFHDPTGAQVLQCVPRDGVGELTTGSELVVFDTHNTVLFRDGTALDVLGPGQHTLGATTVPLLAKLIGLQPTGDERFRASIYFVSNRDFIDQKWGTSAPREFRDQLLGTVHLRAFGNYSFRVTDPRLFVDKVVGVEGVATTLQLRVYLTGLIIARLLATLYTLQLPLNSLPPRLADLSAALEGALAGDFGLMGAELSSCSVTAVSAAEEMHRFSVSG